MTERVWSSVLTSASRGLRPERYSFGFFLHQAPSCLYYRVISGKTSGGRHYGCGQIGSWGEETVPRNSVGETNSLETTGKWRLRELLLKTQ